jgi:hypothetical protein
MSHVTMADRRFGSSRADPLVLRLDTIAFYRGGCFPAFRPVPVSCGTAHPKSDTAPGAPYSSATTPIVGSPEWKRDEAETARSERELARKLNGICRGC